MGKKLHPNIGTLRHRLKRLRSARESLVASMTIHAILASVIVGFLHWGCQLVFGGPASDPGKNDSRSSLVVVCSLA